MAKPFRISNSTPRLLPSLRVTIQQSQSRPLSRNHHQVASFYARPLPPSRRSSHLPSQPFKPHHHNHHYNFITQPAARSSLLAHAHTHAQAHAYAYSTTPSTPSPPTAPSSIEPTSYSFEAISSLSATPDPRRIIIDVREPAELQQTGRVPGALSMPFNSNPDAFYLDPDTFLDRFGFERPRARARARIGRDAGGNGQGEGGTGQSPYTAGMKAKEAEAGLNGEDGEREGSGKDRGREGMEGDGVDEVIFYCKAGVRSKAAARLASEWKGVKIGDMVGGWNEWSSRGGKVERVGSP